MRSDYKSARAGYSHTSKTYSYVKILIQLYYGLLGVFDAAFYFLYFYIVKY